MSQGTPVDADMQQRLLQQCETCVGYVFHDQSSLLSALTHASSAEHRLASNERLEFLGDAILGMVVCEILYLKFPDYSEGDLTRVKSVVVSRQTCARISARLGLERFLILGKGMAGSDRLPSSLLADVFESLIAAIYLDGGYEPAREFVERELAPEIEAAVRARGEDNYKSQLQQLAQRDYGSTPVYQLLDESGPDHSKCFQVAAQVGERQFAPAWGRNKKEAEQLAARHALIALTAPQPTSDSTPDSSSPEAAGCPG
jgi:ribonuclease III